jgi:glycosyltransferase involved in cell wall biosynthesis
MIGNGPLLNETIELVKKEGLADTVHILGAMTPEEVRRHMEQAQIHVFTSDQNEGWGAVLNESMNSACVPVANRRIGSAPYLIKQGENGFTYSSEDELYEKVRCLLDHQKERNEMAKRAYTTIINEWNAEVAAERLLLLSDRILSGEEYDVDTGICSRT